MPNKSKLTVGRSSKKKKRADLDGELLGNALPVASDSRSKWNSQVGSEDWSARELLHRAHALDEWAYGEAERRPNLFAVIQVTRRFLRLFMTTRFIWAALQHSPRRIVAGKNSAIEHLEEKLPLSPMWHEFGIEHREAVVPRSTVYKFLGDDLGLANESAMDEFRCCKNMEEVIALSQPLKELALEVRLFYEEFRSAIEPSKQRAAAAATS